MQSQQVVPRRMTRNRPYDLRKRVLLKNFLRAQNVNQNFSVFNLGPFNAFPTFSDGNGSSEDEKERDEEPASNSLVKDSSDNEIQTSELQEHLQGSHSENEGNSELFRKNVSVKEMSLRTANDSEISTSTENCEVPVTQMELDSNENDSQQILPADIKQNPGPKPSIQSKLSIKKPYTFCRRKSSREPSRKKAKNGILKAKHGFKPPKSPSKKKFNIRNAFSQMFSRKTNSHGYDQMPYDNRDRKEPRDFISRFLKPRGVKQHSRSSASSAASSDKSSNIPNAEFVPEYNLRSVSRSVQTDFSMCCRDFSFNRNSEDHFMRENRFWGLDNNSVVPSADRYQPKPTFSSKRRRYSDSGAFLNSESFSQQKCRDLPSVSKRMQHNSLYCNDQNDFPNQKQVSRVRSLTEPPRIIETFRGQRSKSMHVPNPSSSEFYCRSTYNRLETFGKTATTSHAIVTRSRDAFPENSMNQKYGLDVQHRPQCLLPNPPKQGASSIYRSSSMRESSRNSPLLRKNPMVCRRTRSVNDRCAVDRTASYFI